MTNKITKRKIEKRVNYKTNEHKVELIRELKKQKSKFWITIAKYLANSKRKQVEVNLEKLNQLTKSKDIIIVPGKVLGKGNLEHEITLACFKLTDSAKEKMGKSKIVEIKDLLKEKPSNIKLII